MPQMSGEQLAEQLSAWYPETKVLYISGYVDKTGGDFDRLETEAILLQKPFTPDGLVQRIGTMLDKSAGLDNVLPESEPAADDLSKIVDRV